MLRPTEERRMDSTTDPPRPLPRTSRPSPPLYRFAFTAAATASNGIQPCFQWPASSISFDRSRITPNRRAIRRA